MAGGIRCSRSKSSVLFMASGMNLVRALRFSSGPRFLSDCLYQLGLAWCVHCIQAGKPPSGGL